jgi:predicted ArsR family transcriptional regulator
VRHDLNQTIVRLCVLDDPARRAAYLAVRTAGRPLTRAEVADEVGMSVRLAAFHLEKLLAEGFLEATYERDERSVGVGHPAKRYRPTGLQLEVSLPPRRYDLAAEILAEALEAQSSDPPLESLADTAAEYGRQIGSRARARKGGSRVLTALNGIGYEPATDGDDVVPPRGAVAGDGAVLRRRHFVALRTDTATAPRRSPTVGSGPAVRPVLPRDNTNEYCRYVGPGVGVLASDTCQQITPTVRRRPLDETPSLSQRTSHAPRR